MDFSFISDTALRKKIDDSVGYIVTLSEELVHQHKKPFTAETCRVIVLYAHSIIEALLHEAYQNHEEVISFVEYKDVNELSKKYKHNDIPDGEIVIATRIAREKLERNIGFHELVDFFDSKMLTTETVERMKTMNDLRNSFHLRKGGRVTCTPKDVEESLQLLELTVSKIPGFIAKK